jgi:TM2 domain-containing membrane protein YozV
MICNNCGTAVSDTARWCSGCGLSMTPGGSASIQTEVIDATASPTRASALFADPPLSQPFPAVVCVIHSDSLAAGACAGCGNFYCRACLLGHEGRNYCPSCVARFRAQLQIAPAYQYPQVGTNRINPIESPPYQYQMQVNAYVQPAMPNVKRKEPAVALLLSFFLPGVGQIYNGDIGKGIAFMIGFWVTVWIGIGIVFWIWAMIDAYQSATNINLGRRL